jgi:flagellar hook-basal body complex protein FliE
MSIMAIDAIANSTLAAAPLTPQSAAAGVSFESVLNGLQGLNAQAVADEQAITSFALGQTDNLHQLMIGIERTRLGFELMLAVRTKLLDAYQDLMRTQV